MSKRNKRTHIGIFSTENLQAVATYACFHGEGELVTISGLCSYFDIQPDQARQIFALGVVNNVFERGDRQWQARVVDKETQRLQGELRSLSDQLQARAIMAKFNSMKKGKSK